MARLTSVGSRCDIPGLYDFFTVTAARYGEIWRDTAGYCEITDIGTIPGGKRDTPRSKKREVVGDPYGGR